MTTTQQIISNFTASVENDKTYTLAELTTLLKAAYKNCSNKKGGDTEKVKKAPSAYNIYIKQEMEKLKGAGISPKDRMRQATANWNKQKAENKPVVQQTDESSSEDQE